MLLLLGFSVRCPVRTLPFQFQKNYSNRGRMDTIRTTLTTIADSDRDINPPTSLNEQIRYQLCKVGELQNGQIKEFEIKASLLNTSVLLIKQDNKFHAYSSKCCHYNLPLVKGLNKVSLFFLSF